MKLAYAFFGALLALVSSGHGIVFGTFSESVHGYRRRIIEGLCINQTDNTVLPDPNPRNCHTFYNCLNQMAEEFHCPDNYRFERSMSMCVPGECQSCRAGITHTEPDSCQHFSVCLEGHQVRVACPQGMFFDGARGVCSEMRNDARTKCACVMPEDTVLPNAEDCSTYYYCSRRSPLLMHCSKGHYFSDLISGCLPDVFHQCHVTKVLHETNPHSNSLCGGASPSGERTEGHRVKLQPNPSDPSKYYVCLNDWPVEQECPADSLFNKEKLICEAIGSDSDIQYEADPEEQGDRYLGEKEYPQDDSHQHKHQHDHHEDEVLQANVPNAEADESPAQTPIRAQAGESLYNKLSSKFVSI